jgi:hypothetical protein
MMKSDMIEASGELDAAMCRKGHLEALALVASGISNKFRFA